MRPIRVGEGDERFHWLISGVGGQGEGAPVNWHQHATAEHVMRRQRIGRAEVDIAPAGMKCADFQHHQVERAESVANGFIFAGEAGVGPEENAVPFTLHDQRRPQREVAIFQATAGEVLRWRGGDVQPGARDLVGLPPCQFGDATWRNTPCFEVGADAERRDKGDLRFCQRTNGRVVQMIVVIVRDHHRVDRGQVAEADRYRWKRLGPSNVNGEAR